MRDNEDKNCSQDDDGNNCNNGNDASCTDVLSLAHDHNTQKNDGTESTTEQDRDYINIRIIIHTTILDQKNCNISPVRVQILQTNKMTRSDNNNDPKTIV